MFHFVYLAGNLFYLMLYVNRRVIKPESSVGAEQQDYVLSLAVVNPFSRSVVIFHLFPEYSVEYDSFSAGIVLATSVITLEW